MMSHAEGELAWGGLRRSSDTTPRSSVAYIRTLPNVGTSSPNEGACGGDRITPIVTTRRANAPSRPWSWRWGPAGSRRRARLPQGPLSAVHRNPVAHLSELSCGSGTTCRRRSRDRSEAGVWQRLGRQGVPPASLSPRRFADWDRCVSATDSLTVALTEVGEHEQGQSEPAGAAQLPWLTRVTSL